MPSTSRRSLRRTRLAVIKGLYDACGWIDAVAYRPVVMKLTGSIPRWWHCQLGQLSVRLDDRWGTGYFSSPDAPCVTRGFCEACRRRSAWLVTGGLDLEDDPDPDDYLDTHAVALCGWCHPVWPAAPRTKEDIEEALREAGATSIGWRWRWSLDR